MTRGVNTVVKMGTVAVGGYVGVGLARAAVHYIPGLGDMMMRVGLTSKQGGGATAIVFGLFADPILRAVGVPARFRTNIREGTVLFGIKDLLDPLIEENVYQRMGLSDYLTLPAGQMGDYLRFQPTGMNGLGALGMPQVTSYGVPIPTAAYDGDPFTR